MLVCVASQAATPPSSKPKVNPFGDARPVDKAEVERKRALENANVLAEARLLSRLDIWTL